MTRQELADAVNQHLWIEHGVREYVTVYDIGRLERGETRWPRKSRRTGLRAVLGASADAQLGLYPNRRVSASKPGGIADHPGGEGIPKFARSSDRPTTIDVGQPAHEPGLVGSALWPTPAALLQVAAHDSAALSSDQQITDLSTGTLDHLREDVRLLATDYVATSDVPRILRSTLLLHGRLSALIEQRRPSPRQARELYLLMGATCLLLASVSHDFGEPGAAMALARSAGVFAELAEHHELAGWVLCTKAMVDLWRQRPDRVLAHAAHGEAMLMAGSGRLRLKGLEARALAMLHHEAEAATLMRRLEDDPEQPDRAESMHDLGTVFSFPDTRLRYYAAVTYTHLGDLPAVERSVAALGAVDQAPSTTGTWPVSWALSRGHLAVARLDHGGVGGGPEAAAHALSPVLTMPKVQRIHQLRQVFNDIGQRLNTLPYRGSAAARELDQAVHQFYAEAANGQ